MEKRGGISVFGVRNEQRVVSARKSLDKDKVTSSPPLPREERDRFPFPSVFATSTTFSFLAETSGQGDAARTSSRVARALAHGLSFD